MNAEALVPAGTCGALRATRRQTAGVGPACECGERLQRGTDGLIR